MKTQLPITLRPSRGKWLLMTLGSAAFTAGGLLMLRARDPMGYLATGFFGLCLIVALVGCLPGASYLRLTSEGFVCCTFYRCFSIDWSDVATFGVITIGHQRMVAWNFSPGYHSPKFMRQLSRRVCGFEAALPDTYGRKAEELGGLLSQLHDCFARADDAGCGGFGDGEFMSRISFDSFSVAAPLGWEDITPSVEAIDPPPTLARGDGVGALQFSVALYNSGPVPDPSPEDLSHMVHSFARARGMGWPRDSTVESGPLRLASGSFAWEQDFLRVWQVSDGRNFAFVTYTCEPGQEGRELVECERIVRSLRFREAEDTV